MTEPEPRSTLLRSQLQCPLCDDLIASIHVHDFRTCRTSRMECRHRFLQEMFDLLHAAGLSFFAG